MNSSYHIVSQTPILIDVNNDLVNFKTTFSVTGMEDKPFRVASANQSVIDSQKIDSLEYKLVPKAISGEVSSTDNIHQSHYLILAADSPTKVQVQVHAQALPTNTKVSSTKPTAEAETSGMDMTSCAIIGILCIIVLYYAFKNTNLQSTSAKPSLLGSLRKLNV